MEYRAVYPGIDIAYHGENQRLEYDFILQPRADPASIRLAVDGVDGIRIGAEGDLVLTVGPAEIRQRKPTIYQDTRDGRKLIQGRYVALNGNQIGIELDPYDVSNPVVIDPVVVFSTFFGGNGADSALGMALDAVGNVFIAGQTGSANLSGNDIGNPSFTGSDYAAFVAKVSPAGALLFTTIIAGTNDQALAGAVAVDVNDNVYLTGFTHSASFPTLKFAPVLRGSG